MVVFIYTHGILHGYTQFEPWWSRFIKKKKKRILVFAWEMKKIC